MLVAIRQNRVKGTGVINRYTRPAMGAIWELENKFNIWKEIEVLACEAQAELGKSGIMKEEAAWIRAHADFTVERIDEIEKVTNHDVIAFTTNMAEYIDADVPEGTEPPSRWVHYGMTSSDLGDTALSYQITQAIDIILEDIKQLGETCKRRAFEFQETLCVGRTHGIHAEPMTFGMKFGSWAWALKRAQTRMEEARKVAATGAISGAVGTYSSIDPFVEQYVCERLGLEADPLSTQVLARDRHAQVMAGLAVTASTLESIAMQVRLLQQSDVIEAEEPFAKGQKGSSAMPHKRNPITAERVCGLARTVKSNARWPSTTWRCGTSATSATPVPSGSRWPIASLHSITCSARCSGCLTACKPTRPRWSTTCGARRASSSARRCCWPWWTPASAARTPTSSCNATP